MNELKDEGNFSKKRKFKKRLVKVVPTTSTTVKPGKSEKLMDVRTLEEPVISPEDWLERFYNGKNLLRKAIRRSK